MLGTRDIQRATSTVEPGRTGRHVAAQQGQPAGQHGGARHRAPGGRSDQASMRRSNMGLLLRHLKDHAGQSRARVAAETGLSKATTSSLIGDLVERGLVTEGELHRAGSVGGRSDARGSRCTSTGATCAASASRSTSTT